MKMKQTWRWYGPDDPVSLSDIRQAGATGIVTALHHIPIGEVWTPEEMSRRKKQVEYFEDGTATGLTWSVIESVPVHESIKTGADERDKYIDRFKAAVKQAGELDIGVICYNFMPVLDWTRTDLAFELEDGARALRFDAIALAAFDLFILKRPAARYEYSSDQKEAAADYFNKLTEQKKHTLVSNILAGLPGAQEGYTLSQFETKLQAYEGISESRYRENLFYFLKQVVPVAEQYNVRLAIHPDDPPRPLLGLPRIVGSEYDLREIVEAVDSPCNGITFCTGSLGVNPKNDLTGMIDRLGHKIYFAHLRSTRRDDQGNFYEASHLGGDVDMYAVILGILKEQRKRKESGRTDWQIPMRADHGHTIMDDLHKEVNPGYSGIGLLRGMAELRGLEMGIAKSHNLY